MVAVGSLLAEDIRSQIQSLEIIWQEKAGSAWFHATARVRQVQNTVRAEIQERLDIDQDRWTEICGSISKTARNRNWDLTHNRLDAIATDKEKILAIIRLGGIDDAAGVGHIDSFIETLMQSLTVALENIDFLYQTEANARIDSELEAARTLQESLLPWDLNLPGLDIAGHYASAQQTGGDWYGYFYNAQEHLLEIYVGDVTGHGFAASLLTGVAHGAMYASNHTQSMLPGLNLPIGERLKILANTVNLAVLQAGHMDRLMTMCFVVLNLQTGECTFLNAGHNLPIHLPASGQAKRFRGSGPRLGVSIDAQFSIHTYQMSASDSLLLYTDGLVENSGPDGRVMRERDLLRLLQKCQGLNPEELKTIVLAEAQGYWQNKVPDDDVSLLIVKWHHPIAPWVGPLARELPVGFASAGLHQKPIILSESQRLALGA